VLGLVEDHQPFHPQGIPLRLGVLRGRAGEGLLRALRIAPDDQSRARLEEAGAGSGAEVLRGEAAGERLPVVDGAPAVVAAIERVATWRRRGRVRGIRFDPHHGGTDDVALRNVDLVPIAPETV